MNCPTWCTETHAAEPAGRLDTDHAASFLHDLGGAFVAVHRLDHGDTAGDTRVLVDPGESLAYLTPERARQLALAIWVAADTAEPACSSVM